ncbi:MAG: LuxR C-terminal-related transcriptional regulator [Treponema sp.]|nr:LuxR C-terminal-related transcriptional regulator [Treponema sp.]
MSERDNDTSRFWENFIDGVALTNEKAADRLSKINFPDTERQFERYISIPEEEIDPDTRTLLVYDDFHFINNTSVLRFMEKAVSSPFPNITSIFISRSEPSINTIRFVSKGMLGRITEEDLRFSREEIRDYFALQDITISPQTFSSIYHDTEGWAFAIHLAGLSLKNSPPGAPYIPHAMKSNIFSLIKSEIMKSISKNLQKFLVKLSLIDHLSLDLLKKIEGDDNLIDEMNTIDSFIRFDTYHNAYHIHHLFLDYLKTRHDEIPEEEKKEVWSKTAAWCLENNQKMDAISYYEKAKDYNALIDACFYIPMMYPYRTAFRLLEILDNAPAEIYDTNPLIYTHRLRIFMSLGMFDKGLSETEKAIARFEAMPPTLLTHKILTVVYGNIGYIHLMASTYTGVYNFIPDFECCFRHSLQNGGYAIPLPLSVLNIGSFICRVNKSDKGEVERYIKMLEAVVPLAADALNGQEWGVDTLAHTENTFYKGELFEAEQYALETVKRARERNQFEVENRALFYLLRIYLARGNNSSISQIFGQLEAQIDKDQYINRFSYYDMVLGWYYAHTGQVAKIASWIKNDFEGSDFNSMTLAQEVLTKVRCHMAEKRYPAALAALSTIESRSNQFDAGDFIMGRIELKALEAVCRYRNRDRTGAFAALATAYTLAAPNEYYMPFIELGKSMRSLIESLLKEKPAAKPIPREWLEKIRLTASAYAKKLFTVSEQYREPPQDWLFKNFEYENTPNAKSAMMLSRREKEVLDALQQGMTRNEIAVQTLLSENTIKSVIRNIYNKLGARNKADAVRIAASLKL